MIDGLVLLELETCGFSLVGRGGEVLCLVDIVGGLLSDDTRSVLLSGKRIVLQVPCHPLLPKTKHVGKHIGYHL